MLVTVDPRLSGGVAGVTSYFTANVGAVVGVIASVVCLFWLLRVVGTSMGLAGWKLDSFDFAAREVGDSYVGPSSRGGRRYYDVKVGSYYRVYVSRTGRLKVKDD